MQYRVVSRPPFLREPADLQSVPQLVATEIRGQLSPILGYADLIRSGLEENPDELAESIREFTRPLNSCGQQVLYLVEILEAWAQLIGVQRISQKSGEFWQDPAESSRRLAFEMLDMCANFGYEVTPEIAIDSPLGRSGVEYWMMVLARLLMAESLFQHGGRACNTLRTFEENGEWVLHWIDESGAVSERQFERSLGLEKCPTRPKAGHRSLASLMAELISQRAGGRIEFSHLPHRGGMEIKLFLPVAPAP